MGNSLSEAILLLLLLSILAILLDDAGIFLCLCVVVVNWQQGCFLLQEELTELASDKPEIQLGRAVTNQVH